MSFDLMARAMKIKTGSAIKKLVLLKLCDNASDQGECWPSYQHIADQCEVSRKTVIRHIDELVDMGVVRKVFRKGEKGNSSNIYHIKLPSDTNTLPRVTESPDGVTDSLGGRVTESPRTNHSFEPVNEPNGQQADLIPLSENTLPAKARIELVDRAFDYFWSNWLECKKIVGVKNGSSRKETSKRFHKIFNTAYFKKHTESEFREEINLMCDYAMDNHKNPDDFNPFKNMYTGRFLTNEGWK